MRKFFIFLILVYQKVLSPAAKLLGAECRFYPTCSNYALEAFKKLPLHRAFYLTAKRIVRCGPWSEGGIDPVKI